MIVVTERGLPEGKATSPSRGGTVQVKQLFKLGD